MNVPNPFLRDHVTSTAFALSLGKTHVTALVRLDLELAAEVELDYMQVRGIARAHQMDVQARNGLVARGLVAHVSERNAHKYVAKEGDGSHYAPGKVAYDLMPIGAKWNITRAGRLVIELLQEAGIYQEYAGPMLPLIEARKQRKRERGAA